MITLKHNSCQRKIKGKPERMVISSNIKTSLCWNVRSLWLCVGVWFRHKHIKMSLHNLWLRRLLSSSHFRDPLPTPPDMLNIERGQNFCLEPSFSLSTSNTCVRASWRPSSHWYTHVCASAYPTILLFFLSIDYTVLPCLGQSVSNSLIQNFQVLTQSNQSQLSHTQINLQMHRSVRELLYLTLFRFRAGLPKGVTELSVAINCATYL